MELKSLVIMGIKLSDTQEEEIEALLDVMDELPRPVGGEIGRVENYHLGAKEYVEHWKPQFLTNEKD